MSPHASRAIALRTGGGGLGGGCGPGGGKGGGVGAKAHCTLSSYSPVDTERPLTTTVY
eukprot:CAMPEP_0185546586 /NCGR_PEP_ID=MMETSP1381-20130426/5566_1 /TAXON_ID=298111 /ORGANISM="Pavlova sp., Strain CCMP459" /LENGTH=57 /DNA_ID=CAMNT_0028159043 /DNA_START=813 /DNA_END=983 /DNA_ORIENTATION=+